MSNVLAIDPGSEKSAWVIWNGERVTECGIVDNHELLSILMEQPHTIGFVCERIACYGMPVGEDVFQTCFWIGRFIQAIDPLKMELLPRTKIKAHLCGSTRAKDPNVRQALIDKIGNVGTKKNPGPLYGVRSHIWAALAVAVVFAEQAA